VAQVFGDGSMVDVSYYQLQVDRTLQEYEIEAREKVRPTTKRTAKTPSVFGIGYNAYCRHRPTRE
jgi:hypothetical protein